MVLRTWAILLMAVNILLSGQAIAKETLFTPIAEANVSKEIERHFTPFSLVAAIDKSHIKTLDVQGKLTRISYKVPVSFEPSHIINNYKQQVAVFYLSVSTRHVAMSEN